MTNIREIEAKFEADQQALEQLLALERFGEWAVERLPEKIQDDAYFDTSSEHLKHAGASLRIRRKGPAVLMTFKGDRVTTGSAVSRLEDEVAIAPDLAARFEQSGVWQHEDLPSPLARAVQLTGDAPMVQFARLRTSRAQLVASHPAGAQVELAVDRCRGTRSVDDRQVEFVEVEVELMQGSIADLTDALNALVSTVPGLRPSTTTKLERTLA